MVHVQTPPGGIYFLPGRLGSLNWARPVIVYRCTKPVSNLFIGQFQEFLKGKEKESAQSKHAYKVYRRNLFV
jgi:hypothetical protein